MLFDPTLVTGVGELVAEMRAGDTGKAEGGGRQQQEEEEEEEQGRKKGRCSSCRWPAPKPYQPIGSPGDTGTQRDPPTLPRRALLLLFSPPFYGRYGALKPFFQLTLQELVWTGLRAYCGDAEEWFGGFWLLLMPAAGFI